MHKIHHTFTFAIVFMLLPFTGFGISRIADDELLLFKKLNERLHTIKTISYHYNREFTYPSESYHSKSEGEMYVDFSGEYELVGFRYQYRDAIGFSIFNNAEVFDGNTRDKTIRIANKLERSGFEGRSAIYNSIITLRSIIPLVLADDNIIKHAADTVIAMKSYYLLSFETHNKYPNYLGTDFSKTTQELLFYNKLVISKETFLPLTLLQSKKGSQDLNRTDFTQIKINPVPPAEHSWYYSSYLKEYSQEKKHQIAVIQAGKVSPNFSLTNKQSGLKEELSKYRGQVILLEFWIKNCGYCIEAVSELNELNKKYKSANFKILGINTEDNENSIDSFIKKNKVDYSIWWGNNPDVNKSYGIDSFPQVVLINKASTVLYAGKLDMKKIIELIDTNR